MEYLKTPAKNRRDLDPIDWAIVAVIISGASLIVNIKSKIDVDNNARSDAARIKAISSNRVRIGKIQRTLENLKMWTREIQELGEIVVNNDERGITRTSIVFGSEYEAEMFNEIFDQIMHSISRINRLISEIDSEGLPLKDEDLYEFVELPIERLKQDSIRLLDPDIETQPLNRLNRLIKLLDDYILLLQNLDEVISRRD